MVEEQVSDAAILDKVADYYSGRIRTHGATARGVDWRDGETQELRFAQLARVFSGAETGSVAEIGCGYGAMALWMRRLGIKLAYRGYDVSPDMIEAAGEACSGMADVSFAAGSTPNPADFIVASGIFNVRMDVPDDHWRAYVERTITCMHEQSRRGFAFNCLTGFSDADRKEPRLWYPFPGEMLDWCMRRFGRHAALYHDYGLYEFTIIVRREAEYGP